MARSRPQQSLADYVAIAISPALIMLLVGSLVFFLLQITYNGAYQGRVQWMLFWFVFASVLTARIGIEQGRGYAAGYSGVMGLVCALFAFRFLDEYIVGTLVLLGVIAWCADRLTWDCTFIDDGEDSSGEGLLQKTGIEEAPPDDTPEEPPETELQRRRRERRERRLQQLALESGEAPPPAAAAAPVEEESAKAKKKRKHAPGVWVVYFSLLALPLFGIGQAFLPRDDAAARSFGFRLLWVYVASALSLLLTTSFLGLRRYLRQRRLQMPRRITVAWLTTGLSIIVGVLLLCLLIPRPQAETSVTALLDKFSKEQQASQVALAANDAGEGEGRRAGEHREDEGEPGNEQGKQGAPQKGEGEGKKSGGDQQGKQQGSSKQQDSQAGQGQDKNADSKPGQQQSEQQQDDSQRGRAEDRQQKDRRGDSGDDDQEKRRDNDNRGQRQIAKQDDEQNRQGQQPKQQEQEQQAGSQTPPPTPPSMPPILSSLAQWLKWAIFIVLGGLVVWMLWRNRVAILQGAGEFFRSLANFWRNLFAGRKRKRKPGADDEADGPQGPRRKSFADFDNPYRTGAAGRMRADALVMYTQEAFRAFGLDQGVEADVEQTAIEFGREVEARFPELGPQIQFLTNAYSRVLYSERPPIDFDTSAAEELWRGMERVTQGYREGVAV